jgi:hypothetical protein
MELAKACGAPSDAKADGVIRWATGKLQDAPRIDSKEWWVEVADDSGGSLDVIGFDASVPAVIADFVRG